MPVTLWEDIVGYTCQFCGKWATHFWFNRPICCSCHTGYPDIEMEEEAIRHNTEFQKHGKLTVLDEECDLPLPSFFDKFNDDWSLKNEG